MREIKNCYKTVKSSDVFKINDLSVGIGHIPNIFIDLKLGSIKIDSFTEIIKYNKKNLVGEELEDITENFKVIRRIK